MSAGGVSHPSDLPNTAPGERSSQQWLAWRRSGQSVMRSWNEWLAADSDQRAECYHRYISALAEEERAAAELDRMVSRTAKAHDAAVA